MGASKFTPDLQGFRFYDDDGGEAAATPLDAEDTNINVDVSAGNVQIQMRAMVQEAGAGSISGATTDDYGIQYNKNVSGNVTLDDVSSNIRAFASTGLTDGAATTNRADGSPSNGVTDGTGSFVAGEQEADNGLIEDHQLTADNFTEHVFAFELVAADLADADSIALRMTLNGGNPGMANTIAPTITITKGGGPVVNAVAVARLALASAAAAAKTAAQIATSRLALGAADATTKISTGTAPVSVALRASSIAEKVYAGVAVARMGLRTLAAFSLTTVIEGVAFARIALRSLSAAAKTAPAAGRASVALRGSDAAGKIASAAGQVRGSLRALIAASVPAVFAASIRVGLALRATDGAATTRAAQILGRLAISTSNSGQKTMAGVAFNRFALRATDTTSTEAIGSTVRKVPLDGLFDFNVPLEGHGNPVN